jgi:hypothetical protein
MKKWMTLLFASMLALTLSLPGWSQTSTGTKNASQTSATKATRRTIRRRKEEKRGQKGDKKGSDEKQQ